MINTNIYNYINVLDKAADAANLRNEMLTNNIANADTPHYKRKDVSFEGYLQHALHGGGSLDSRVNQINQNLSELGATIYTDNMNLSYRLDGNNVDIDVEAGYLAQNQIRYNALISQIGQEFGRYKSVLSGM